MIQTKINGKTYKTYSTLKELPVLELIEIWKVIENNCPPKLRERILAKDKDYDNFIDELTPTELSITYPSFYLDMFVACTVGIDRSIAGKIDMSDLIAFFNTYLQKMLIEIFYFPFIEGVEIVDSFSQYGKTWYFPEPDVIDKVETLVMGKSSFDEFIDAAQIAAHIVSVDTDKKLDRFEKLPMQLAILLREKRGAPYNVEHAKKRLDEMLRLSSYNAALLGFFLTCRMQKSQPASLTYFQAGAGWLGKKRVAIRSILTDGTPNFLRSRAGMQ